MDNYREINSENCIIVHKPAIPDKVQHWLDTYKDKYDLFEVVHLAKNYDNAHIHIGNCDEDVAMWIGSNLMKFASAWLYGYTVETDKLYEVNVLGNILIKVTKEGNTEYKMVLNPNDAIIYTEGTKYDIYLTENDIKQCDERLWQFAEPVEE